MNIRQQIKEKRAELMELYDQVQGLRSEMITNEFADIVDSVCYHFSVSKDEIFQRTKVSTIVGARQVVQYFCVIGTNMSMQEIANRTGITTHATVIYSKRQVVNHNETDPMFRERLTKVKEDLGYA